WGLSVCSSDLDEGVDGLVLLLDRLRGARPGRTGRGGADEPAPDLRRRALPRLLPGGLGRRGDDRPDRHRPRLPRRPGLARPAAPPRELTSGPLRRRTTAGSTLYRLP